MFEFRLQKVLDFRETQEAWAKENYLASRAARIEVENKLHDMRARRGHVIENTPADIESRRALEATLLHLDDQERAETVVLKVLLSEEETALKAWTHAKQEVEVLARLREAALAEHLRDESRREQSALDEWAILRPAFRRKRIGVEQSARRSDVRSANYKLQTANFSIRRSAA